MPPHPALARLGGVPVEVGEALALRHAVPAELVAQIGVAQARIRGVEPGVVDDERLLVVHAVEVVAGDAAIVASDDLVFVMQQRLAEPRVGHAQIGVVDIPLVQSGQLGVSACDLMPGLVVKRVPGGQGETQRPRGEGTGGLQMLVELDVRRGSAVIFRHGRIGREISDVEFVDQVGRERVVEHVGDERQSVQRHTVLLQPVCERRAARGAVGFAEHVFGRVPAVVFAQVRPDERAEAGDIAVHRPQFRLGRVEDLGESGAGRVDEHEVGDGQQRVRVVHERVGGGRHRSGVGDVDALRGDRTHEQERGG